MLAQMLALGNKNRGLDREMAMQEQQAELMRGQTPEGQMVSGRYVKPHALQYLGELAKSYSGRKWSERALETGGKRDANTADQNTAMLAMLVNAMRRPGQMNGPGVETAPVQGPGPMAPQPLPPMMNRNPVGSGSPYAM